MVDYSVGHVNVISNPNTDAEDDYTLVHGAQVVRN